jgi:hypothetical protein
MKYPIRMNKKAIWLITGLLFLGSMVMAQCNYKLVEKAAQQAGSDAVYIRDFKVKLSQGTMDEPSPTGKFPVYLNKGVIYRFSVANAEEFNGRAMVEIMRRDQVYAGNYDFNNKIYSETFDFICDRSSTYQILINYGEGKEGCSAVVMAMVFQVSMAYIEPGLPFKSDSAGILYLFTENKLQIASSAGKDVTLEVSISQGSIEQKGQFFIARPNTIGEARVDVIVKKGESVVETDSVIYNVEYPPLPLIQLPGESGGTLSLSKFPGFGSITILDIFENEKPIYALKQFSISIEGDMMYEIQSDGNQLSPQQIMMIKKLSPGNKIYIRDVVFIDPLGNTHSAVSRGIPVIE